MMANAEHLAILKQGVAQWNAWREQHPYIRPDLRYTKLLNATLSDINLSHVNLRDAILNGTNLFSANLSSTNLTNAGLSNTDLTHANLNRASLKDANLNHAQLNGANLQGANLSNAVLSAVSLSNANLSDAILNGASLNDAILNGTILGGSSLQEATVGSTVFARIDLRQVKGLTELIHQGPSCIELYTIQLPLDGSAFHFLRGVGVVEEWIDFYRAQILHPIQYHSCFISYSSQDEQLARRLHADLQAHGVRCWFAPEDMKTGDKIRPRIDEAIHQQEKLLLLLSEHSIKSSWVANEVEAALEKEDRQGREVLFPIRLDETVMHTPESWAATIRRTRHIGDFTAWTDPEAYTLAFERLLRDLKKAEKQEG